MQVSDVTIMACGTKNEAPPQEGSFKEKYGLDDSPITFLEPPFGRNYNAENCICHQARRRAARPASQTGPILAPRAAAARAAALLSPSAQSLRPAPWQENALGLAVFCMVMFSLCVQAAEGLHYGIVPYVSRPALGIVSGMVSAGGNLGAVILLWSFFEAGDLRLDEGFLRLGMVVCGLTALLVLVYFPEKGSMLTPARALGDRYDPQLIKPPSDYRGADSVRMFVLGQVLVLGR